MAGQPISRAELLETLNWLDRFYSSPEGLARPNGLSVAGKPDFEGIAAWVLDVYLNSRIGGLDVATSRQNVIHAIQQTTEWRTRHPEGGGVPGTDFRQLLDIGRGEFLTALLRLDVFYKSWNGL